MSTFYSPLVRDRARILFIEGMTDTQISKQLKIKVEAVREWISIEDWESQKRDRARADVHELGDIIIEQEKPHVVERQVRIAQKLDQHIEKALDKKTLKSRDLVNLSKAAQGSCSVADSALGLKKAATLQVFVQFNLKPARVQDALRSGAITVDALPADIRETALLTSGALPRASSSDEQQDMNASRPNPEPS